MLEQAWLGCRWGLGCSKCFHEIWSLGSDEQFREIGQQGRGRFADQGIDHGGFSLPGKNVAGMQIRQEPVALVPGEDPQIAQAGFGRNRVGLHGGGCAAGVGSRTQVGGKRLFDDEVVAGFQHADDFGRQGSRAVQREHFVDHVEEIAAAGIDLPRSVMLRGGEL